MQRRVVLSLCCARLIIFGIRLGKWYWLDPSCCTRLFGITLHLLLPFGSLLCITARIIIIWAVWVAFSNLLVATFGIKCKVIWSWDSSWVRVDQYLVHWFKVRWWLKLELRLEMFDFRRLDILSIRLETILALGILQHLLHECVR